MIKPALFVSCKPRVCVSVCLSSCPAACISVFASLRNKGDVLLILGFTFIRALLYQLANAPDDQRVCTSLDNVVDTYIQDGRNERKAFKSVHMHTSPYTYMHSHTYTYAYTRMCTAWYKYTYMGQCRCTQTHTNKYTHVHI